MHGIHPVERRGAPGRPSQAPRGCRRRGPHHAGAAV